MYLEQGNSEKIKTQACLDGGPRLKNPPSPILWQTEEIYTVESPHNVAGLMSTDFDRPFGFPAGTRTTHSVQMHNEGMLRMRTQG